MWPFRFCSTGCCEKKETQICENAGRKWLGAGQPAQKEHVKLWDWCCDCFLLWFLTYSPGCSCSCSSLLFLPVLLSFLFRVFQFTSSFLHFIIPCLFPLLSLGFRYFGFLVWLQRHSLKLLLKHPLQRSHLLVCIPFVWGLFPSFGCLVLVLQGSRWCGQSGDSPNLT